MRHSIYVGAHLDAAALDYLRENLRPHGLHFADKHSPKPEDASRFAGSQIAFGNVPADWLTGPNSLEWLQLESIGFEYYQSVADRTGRIMVTNLKGMFDRPAAETALAGLLALARGLDKLLPAQREQRWMELEVRPQTWLLHGRSVLLLGLGSIGRRMKRLLEALDCKVVTFARTNTEATLHAIGDLPDAFEAADIVVCCLPRTPATVGLVDARLLSRLRPHAVFVNIGRGAVVDEPALVNLLAQERIGGAVLDVTHREPLPDAHPLWICPRTILTQHTGGGYRDELLDKARFFVANLRRLERGEPLLNRIDLAKGY